MPEEYPDFPHHTHIKDYLDAYVDAFGLRESIEFENGVVSATPRPGGGWVLETQRTGTREADLLVVANGHHWDPRYPDFPPLRARRLPRPHGPERCHGQPHRAARGAPAPPARGGHPGAGRPRRAARRGPARDHPHPGGEGGSALVIGAGPVGIAVALNLRSLGVSTVLLAEPSEQRRSIAAGLGLEVLDPAAGDATAEVKARTGGAGADAVFECAGLPATFVQALSAVRAGGDVSLVATYKAPVELDPNALLFSEIRVGAALAYLPEDVEAVIAGLARGDFPLEGWVQHIALADMWEDGFEASRQGRAMKVLVDL